MAGRTSLPGMASARPDTVSLPRARISARPTALAMPRRSQPAPSRGSHSSPPPSPLGHRSSPGPSKPAAPSASSDSAVAAVTGKVGSWWQAYTRRLEADPVKTKAVTSFLGFMVGDFLAQRIGGEPFSPLRCLRLGAYGLFLDGPIGHVWYKVLDKNVMPDKPRSTSAVLIKTAADQLIWAPIMTVVFFAVLKSLEGHPELIWETVQDKLVKTVVANYILWPGAHFINFKFVPTEHRILYNNCVSVVWNAYLSTLSHAPEIDAVQLLDQAQSTAGSLTESAAKMLPAELGLSSGPVQLPPIERLLPEGATFPEWFKLKSGPIILAPFERLLPEGSSFESFRLELPRKIQLAPARALYPMWLHLFGPGSP